MKQNKEPDLKRVNLLFSTSDLEKVKELAEQTGLSVSHLIRLTCKLGMKEIEKDPNSLTIALFSTQDNEKNDSKDKV